MNTVVTSKEAILQTSRELIQKQGWSAVSIRSVASTCGISVGSIYNYFNNKADLIAATVESVWIDIFHFPEEKEPFQSFDGCVEWMFDRMRKGNEKYPGFFTMHSLSFLGEDSTGGQQLMEKSWRHIKDGLYTVLMQDQKVHFEVFDEQFTPEKFVEIQFSLMISALLRHDYDCSGILGMVRRILYR